VILLMTKPNQGALFSHFRDQIMGVILAQNPSRSAPNVKSECLDTSGSKASGCDHRSVLAKKPNPAVMGPMNVISAQNPSRSAPNVKSECLVTSGSKASGRDHRSVLAKKPNPVVMGPMNPTFQGTTTSSI